MLSGRAGLWCFAWWAPSANSKDHHRVSSRWSSIWLHFNRGLVSTRYGHIPIVYGFDHFDWFVSSAIIIVVALWDNSILPVEITPFILVDIVLQHDDLLQCCGLVKWLDNHHVNWSRVFLTMTCQIGCPMLLFLILHKLFVTSRWCVTYVRKTIFALYWLWLHGLYWLHRPPCLMPAKGR